MNTLKNILITIAFIALGALIGNTINLNQQLKETKVKYIKAKEDALAYKYICGLIYKSGYPEVTPEEIDHDVKVLRENTNVQYIEFELK